MINNTKIQGTSFNEFIDIIHELVGDNPSTVDVESIRDLFDIYGGGEFDYFIMTIWCDLVTVVEAIKECADGEDIVTKRKLFFPSETFYKKHVNDEDQIDQQTENLIDISVKRYKNHPTTAEIQKYDQFGALLSL